MVMILGRKFYIIPKLEQSLKLIFPSENIPGNHHYLFQSPVQVPQSAKFNSDELSPTDKLLGQSTLDIDILFIR